MPNQRSKVCLLAALALPVALCADQADFEAAYKALATKDYDHAITGFRAALAQDPGNAAAHKDLAYTLLKAGENEAARDEFEAALKLNAKDETAALEYAFLAYETGKPAEARRMFYRLRLSTNKNTRATAETAYQNIDKPLVDGIQRWTEALRRSPNPNSLPLYSAHWELAELAEKRDEWSTAAEHYGICRQLKPQEGEPLLALARVWKHLDRGRDANAALLATSRWRDTRTAELAREQFGTRYPYPYEFVDALKLDPKNVPLRKELAYLYLAMHKEQEATAEFAKLLEIEPDNREIQNQLSALQAAKSGFKPRSAAAASPKPAPAASAKEMGKKSLALGYTRDAIRYLRQAHEDDPDDPELLLKLGYAYNLAKDDTSALKWFDQARRSSDSAVASEAAKAWRNLHGDTLPQTTIWTLPMYSTRWHDLFTYGQIKRNLPLPWTIPHHWFSLYLSTRFIGDLRSSMQWDPSAPTYLSESSFIVGAGVQSKTWHHLTGWAEAGEAFKYLASRRDVGAAIPDYRGGVNFAKGFGTLLGANKSGFFYETTADAIYVSRFGKDWLFNSQNRVGRTFRFNGTTAQALFNANYLRDSKGEYWANAIEMGPGVKLRLPFMPQNVYFSGDVLRGVYTKNEYNPRRPNYNDVRIGLWYALSR